MANGGPVCDRCGLEQAHYRFCPSCRLFVCDSCWQSDSSVCLSCARPNLPPPGQVPVAIRGTIGQRSLGVSTTGSRLGQALTGPGGEPSAPASSDGGSGQAPPSSRARSRRSPLLTALLLLVVAFALLLGALYVGPVVSRLLAEGSATPSAAPLSTPESGVQGQRSTPKPAPRTYVVRGGDTLRSIAVAVYGDEERWREIYRANRSSIRDPDALVVGQTLQIPDR